MSATASLPYSKQEFIYECCLRGLQGSLANPNQQASVASLVRDAERLWEELQEWERQNATPTDE